MKKQLILITAISLISACSTMQPPRYAVSVDNIQALKKYQGAKVQVSGLSQSSDFSANCRLMGPIEPADGLSIPEFVSKAINDEFKMAGIHSSEGNQLSGTISNIEFSSTSGLTNGYWNISLELSSSNGQSLAVSNKYTFKSGFDAVTACNATADALSPAVQDLIKVLVTHPQFQSLL